MPLPSPLLLFFWMRFVTATTQTQEFESRLGDLTNGVIEKHFGRFRCVTYVLDEGVEMSFGREGLPVLVIRLPAEKALLTESFEQGCGGYVVRVEDKPGVVRRLIKAKHSARSFRYNNQRYLFLPIDSTDDATALLQEPEMFFMPNLALVIPENDSLLVTTHTIFDYHKHDLLGIFQEDVDLWIPGTGFTFGRDLYPDRLLSVNGKKFVFAMINYSPFSLVLKEGNRTVFDGFEARIAAEFVAKVNGTWEGLNHPVDLYGRVFPNGSGTGLVGSIIDHRADFGFAAIYQWFCDECDCAYPMYQSEVTCLVPRPRQVSGWLTIILPFTINTWIALVVTYFLTSTFLIAMNLALQYMSGDSHRKIGTAISDSFFTNIRLQLEQVPDVRKMKAPVSVYVKVSVYYYFFVAAFWQGGIASILTLPRFESPIDTVEDLIANWPKVKWGGNTEAWMNSLKYSSDPHLLQIVHKFVVLDDDTLHWRTTTNDFGFFMEKLPHGHYGYNDFIREDSMKYLRLMEGNVYTAFGVIIQPKGSPYAEKFDKTILRLYDTGIIHKLEVQVSLDRINNRLQNMIRFSNRRDHGIVTLAVKHIQGALFILAVGMTLAAVVFLLEISVYRPKVVCRQGLPVGERIGNRKARENRLKFLGDGQKQGRKFLKLTKK